MPKKGKRMAHENYQKGMATRRQVMGDKFVDKAMDSVTDFSKPVQDYINENCWGAIWSRETLPLKIRSVITIAVLAALKSPIELKGHIRGAINNGCSKEEIQEILLHTAPYIGAPALQEAFRAAEKAFEE
jgi:4-carboxymuconolactone decarboxylase|tara:strand:- start:1024 stop:1413 length:390 start_codon:yes stop_codon:yes gene_type:complete